MFGLIIVVITVIIIAVCSIADTKEEKKSLQAEKRKLASDAQARRLKQQKELDNHNKEIDRLKSQKVALEKSLVENKRSADAMLAEQRNKFNNWEASLREREATLNAARSNLTGLPYMAAVIADYDTRGLEILAKKLDWGSNQERAKKVASIRTLRKETQDLLAQYKEAEYQLAYAIKMFPALEDFIETEYSLVSNIDFSNLSSENHDAARNYLSAEEYASLTSSQRNQLALDRYLQSHKKTNWQIGRDYELFVGHRYTKKGYSVDYYGSNNGLEDLGRDLIAVKDNAPTLIIQCKYWSTKKVIHEKHINQLFGTMTCYCFENDIPAENVRGLLVTNTTLSDTARRFAKYLGIEVVENYSIGEFPRIKCNINTDEHGNETKIYHLPFDQQYDSCKIDKPGEFFAYTVAEAEAAGFRRAFKWYS